MYEAPAEALIADHVSESEGEAFNRSGAQTTGENDFIAGRVWLETGAGDPEPDRCQRTALGFLHKGWRALRRRLQAVGDGAQRRGLRTSVAAHGK